MAEKSQDVLQDVFRKWKKRALTEWLCDNLSYVSGTPISLPPGVHGGAGCLLWFSIPLCGAVSMENAIVSNHIAFSQKVKCRENS